MPHPSTWIQPRTEGLCCEPADIWIDPVEPVPRAIITHGHADHARAGHGAVLATPETLAIMRSRFGEDHAQEQIALDYGQRVSLGPSTELTLLPAGHILGSAQVLVSTFVSPILGGMTIVVLAAAILRINPRGLSFG